MENNQEESTEKESDETGESKTKQWFRDNLRIIISILIVVLIAGGIYSYSRRSENTQNNPPQQNEQSQSNQAANENTQATNENSTAQTQNQAQNNQTSQSNTNVSASQETDNSFIETAARGDSVTKLARRALADYLEKNSDPSLSAEHKIYIEDFLRKNVPFRGRVGVGTSVEFSKSLIQNAITKSKTLNDRQLQNLHKYVVRVPSLS